MDILKNISFNPYDILFVIVVLVGFFVDYIKGFLYSVVSLFKVIGSAIVAGYVSDRFAYTLYERFLKDIIVNKVTEQLSDFRDGIIKSFGNDLIGRALNKYIQSFNADNDISQLSNVIVSEGIEKTVVNGFQLVLFLSVFIVLIILLSWLQGILVHTNDVPILGFLNRLLGGLLGVIISLILLYLISMFISILLKYNSTLLSQETILESSYFSILYKLNPFFE